MEEQEQADRLSEAFWRADGGVSDTPRQQMRTLSGIQAERRALHARIRATEREEEAARRGRRVLVGEDVPSENGGNRLGNDVHGTKGGGQEGLRCGAAHQGQRREGGDVVLVCVPKDVNACEKSVLSSGPTAFELRTSTSSASVPFQDDSRQLRGR
ncbi:hypothetical protein JG688_00011464 [Phytophthora aleatoria]|uniref:Uncharacterized protein n=1 Tax=Phytophthora aleatoria TaxID=2496075 RepID=A0A8J5M2Q0_9STRA|nr:hypothetical protein JG688_00011464 [Phytophthora aleatoria]